MTTGAQWCQLFGKALVANNLSIDAAAELFGMKRVRVQQLLRSDTVRRPQHVCDWLDAQIDAALVSDQAIDD